MVTKARIGGDDLAGLHAGLEPALIDVLTTSLATSSFVAGERIVAFETAWASYCGARYAVGTASGTSALELTLHALGVCSGDEVLVPANTFFATVEAIARAGARPVYVDVDETTMLIDLDDAESKVTRRTRALIVVHLYGNMCDLDRASALASQFGIHLVEDAAQAHGSMWQGRPAGGWGNPACFSFYPSKNLGALGNAGAVVTDDISLARTVRSMADHGRDPGGHDAHVTLGVNERMDALQAGFLSVKLPRLDGWNRRRRQIAAYYDEHLPREQVTLVEQCSGSDSSFHQYVVHLDDRDAVRQRMRAAGVETRVRYPVPCSKQPASIALWGEVKVPVVERLAPRLLSLPCSPTLDDLSVERVVEVLRSSL